MCPGKERENLKEKEKDILQLERSVRRLEAIVAAEAKVKEETEQKVVEEKAVGAGQWLSGFWVRGRRGPLRTCHGTRPGWPPPPRPRPPPPRPPGDSSLDSFFFFHAAGALKEFGAGEVGMGGPRGGGAPEQALAGGGVGSQGAGGGNRSCPGGSGGRRPPPRKRG